MEQLEQDREFYGTIIADLQQTIAAQGEVWKKRLEEISNQLASVRQEVDVLKETQLRGF